MEKIVDVDDFEKISLIFRGHTGRWLAQKMMHIFSLDRVNEAYSYSAKDSGAKFASTLLEYLGVRYRIGNADSLNQLSTGPFITISNHPYGGLDGIMLIDLMATLRPDYKVMVNKILSLVKAMDENFISVIPRVDDKQKEIKSTNINGVRDTLMHLHEGHPMGFFPAGAVSNFCIKDRCIEDREWQKNVIKIIKRAKVPVLPIRFFDKNSFIFYFLGLINWRIRLLRMPYEVFNKKKQLPRIGIGPIIPVEEQLKYKNLNDFGVLLRNSIYQMPLPKSFIFKDNWLDKLRNKSSE